MLDKGFKGDSEILMESFNDRMSDNQKSDFMKCSVFLPDDKSVKLEIFTRPNQILPYQKCDKMKQQQVINFSFQDSF